MYLIQPTLIGEAHHIARQIARQVAAMEVLTTEVVTSEAVVLAEIIKIVLKYIKQKRAFRKRFFLILK
jgi:hypothetical protein